MANPIGFLSVKKQDRSAEAIKVRVQHYNEFIENLSDAQVQEQASRCMDCGIPFCHTGCPVHNQIPDWNDLVHTNDWKQALINLHSTNNFPEFTGRICPAPCEESCTLNLTDEPVSIKTIEQAIVEKGWDQGWIRPKIAERKSGKKIAVVGSGPAGLACAQQLARAGHRVDVYEKQPAIGGLLRFGIPDFKLSKKVIDRRLAQLRSEGVVFHTNTQIGGVSTCDSIKVLDLKTMWKKFEAIVLACGSEVSRDLTVEGRGLKGVHFAMEFLGHNSKWVQGHYGEDRLISAKDKKVLVIGGGDTGSDCIGTSHRHGASAVTQIEILPKPPKKEDKAQVWPNWPNKVRTSSSQEEGCERLWSVATKQFLGDEHGNIKAALCIKVDWQQDANGQWKMQEVAGSEFEIACDLVTLAMGFVHPVQDGLIRELDVEFDARGNVAASVEGKRAFQTTVDGVFATGDTRRGQSLVVWAIREGRQAARSVDAYLNGSSELPL